MSLINAVINKLQQAVQPLKPVDVVPTAPPTTEIKGAPDPSLTADPSNDSADTPQPDTYCDTESVPSEPVSCADPGVLPTELQLGMQVSLDALEYSDNGFRYRGFPVLVYNPALPEVDAASARAFAALVHTRVCCGALASSDRRVWITTHPAAAHAPGLALTMCPTCVVPPPGFRGRPGDPIAAPAFDFVGHLRKTDPAVDGPFAWRPGSPMFPLRHPDGTSLAPCSRCDWHAPVEHRPDAQIAEYLGAPESQCLLCAEAGFDGALLPSVHLLEMAYERVCAYRALGVLPAGALPWSLVHRLLPRAWHPFVAAFARRLPDPELFVEVEEQLFVLAWPAQQRGIAVDPDTAVEDWAIWSIPQALSMQA